MSDCHTLALALDGFWTQSVKNINLKQKPDRHSQKPNLILKETNLASTETNLNFNFNQFELINKN